MPNWSRGRLTTLPACVTGFGFSDWEGGPYLVLDLLFLFQDRRTTHFKKLGCLKILLPRTSPRGGGGGGVDHKLATHPSKNTSIYRARDNVLEQKREC